MRGPENKEMRDGLALRAQRPVGDRTAKSMADRGLQDGDDLSPRGHGDTECQIELLGEGGRRAGSHGIW